MSKYQRKSFKLICEVCGSDFESLKPKSRFCSPACAGHVKTNHDWNRGRAEEIMILRNKDLSWKEVASELSGFNGTGPVLRATLKRKMYLFTEEEREKFFSENKKKDLTTKKSCVKLKAGINPINQEQNKMKLIPIFYFLKNGKVKIIWCEYLSNKSYDSRWMGEEHNDIVGLADCDIAEKFDICENLEAAHDLVHEYYKNLKS